MLWLGTLQGYRADTLSMLELQDASAYRVLRGIGALTLSSALAVGFAAYGGLRVTGMPWHLSAAVAVGAAWFILNLHRLINAGAGLALGLDSKAQERWRPSAWPVLVFASLGAVLSQPGLVALRGSAGESAVVAKRAELEASHAQLVLAPLQERQRVLDAELARLQLRRADVPAYVLEQGSDTYLAALDVQQRTLVDARAKVLLQLVTAQTEQLAYRQHLAGMQFPLSRLNAIWESPALAGILSFLFVLWICAPSIARTACARTMRRYESERAFADTQTVARQYPRVEQRVATLMAEALEPLRVLHAYARRRSPPSLQAPFADAPFNREPLVSRFERARKASPAELLARAAGRHTP